MQGFSYSFASEAPDQAPREPTDGTDGPDGPNPPNPPFEQKNIGEACQVKEKPRKKHVFSMFL